MTTLSVVKADVGGLVGHVAVHPDVLAEAERRLEAARDAGLLRDFRVLRVGDDIQLIMTHDFGPGDSEIHRLAWDVLRAGADIAAKLGLYGAGQDLLSDAFSGTVCGLGPGSAEMSFEERRSEPVVIFMADKTSAGAWNLPLYRMFADPFNTAGLVLSTALQSGYRFEVHDVVGHRRVMLDTPEESYALLALIGSPSRYAVKAVYHRRSGDTGAVSSVDRLNLIAGKYVGKDDPVCIVRCQGTFPAVGEVLEPFSLPHLVAGWMRGSHHGPLTPVPFRYASPTRFDGPPRVIAAGFQITNGKLIGPLDLFDDLAFDTARAQALQVASYLRQHGPMEPHRLGAEEMEYTTLPEVLDELVVRFQPLETLVFAGSDGSS
ncbi:MAG: fructose 1,6-bisphosphatase [Chloroflexi bacterium]|nr:fructose 1,6-bisphosphatase [Chloroflexota bacterium]